MYVYTSWSVTTTRWSMQFQISSWDLYVFTRTFLFTPLGRCIHPVQSRGRFRRSRQGHFHTRRWLNRPAVSANKSLPSLSTCTTQGATLLHPVPAAVWFANRPQGPRTTLFIHVMFTACPSVSATQNLARADADGLHAGRRLPRTMQWLIITSTEHISPLSVFLSDLSVQFTGYLRKLLSTNFDDIFGRVGCD